MAGSVAATPVPMSSKVPPAACAHRTAPADVSENSSASEPPLLVSIRAAPTVSVPVNSPAT